MVDVTLLSNNIQVTMRLAHIGDAGLCHDGTIWCLPGSVLLRYEKPSRPQVDRNETYHWDGAQLNVTGTLKAHGFDARASYDYYNQNLNAAINGQIPYTFTVGDSMIVSNSLTVIDQTRGVFRNYYPLEASRSCIQYMTAVFCVAVGPGAASDLRPAVVGNSTQKAATNWIPYATVQAGCATLPTRVDTTGYVRGLPPNIGVVYCADGTVSGWTSEAIAPAEQNPGYGRAWNTNVSLDLAFLVSNTALANKYPVARGVCQTAIDVFSTILSGRELLALGGHCQGRKALVVMAGHIIGLANYANPTGYARSLKPTQDGYNPFQEDDSYIPITWFNGWTSGWRMTATTAQPYPGLVGIELQNDPGSWSQEPYRDAHTSMQWAMNGYFSHDHESSVGGVLAMLEIGRKGEIGVNYYTSIQQFIRGPSAGAITAIAAAGVNVSWGTSRGDSSATIPQGWCAREFARLWP